MSEQVDQKSEQQINYNSDRIALEYSKWIELAEERNLFLTPQSYKLLTKDKAYKMVEIDYLNFLYQECPKKYKPTKVYGAQDIYKNLIHMIAPTHVITVKEGNVVFFDKCNKCANTIIKSEQIITNYGLKCPDLGWDFYTVNESKWLTTGNGDGLTRWMLWEDLKKMPNVYYRKSHKAILSDVHPDKNLIN